MLSGSGAQPTTACVEVADRFSVGDGQVLPGDGAGRGVELMRRILVDPHAAWALPGLDVWSPSRRLLYILAPAAEVSRLMIVQNWQLASAVFLFATWRSWPSLPRGLPPARRWKVFAGVGLGATALLAVARRSRLTASRTSGCCPRRSC